MATIGIFDSGCGGLSVLKELLRVLPKEKYIYYSDAANCPYGEKTVEFITSRSRSISAELLQQGADIVVVACNTATAAAIRTLRTEWPDVPFVGMEPAIKPAAADTASGVVGVLATKSTLHAARYHETRDRYTGNVRVVEQAGKGFVELVENGDFDSEKARSTVGHSLLPLLEQGADVIVLGCTHYPFLLPLMQEIAGPDVKFIDPAPAVARRVTSLMNGNGLKHEERLSVEIRSSGSVETARRLYEKISKDSEAPKKASQL